MKNNIYSWVWKWHFIGGIISLPIVMLLSITGIIYLFKDTYEEPLKHSLKHVEVKENQLTFQEQWQIVKQNWDKKPTGVILPQNKNEATEFISGRFSNKSSIFIDPYTGKINGKLQANKTDMHTVRKLHGELLLGTYGTKVIELVASWMVVLIITGIYLFWPRGRGWKGLFTVRFNNTKRILFRDLHAVFGFWFSALLLLILAGGLPWTDVWGTGFKWVHEKTNTGFPDTWKGRSFKSTIAGTPLTLDKMVSLSKSLNLPGEVSISIPKSEKAIFSVSNQTSDLQSMSMVHFDQYSGEIIHKNTWSDIGIMMKARRFAMAFHQGQFGLWNWLLVLFIASALLFMSITAILSYLQRKQKGSWGVPKISSEPTSTKVPYVMVAVLSLFLPLFGLSVIVIYLSERFFKLGVERK